jgi:type I restriction-modification system DNA methylase subunit
LRSFEPLERAPLARLRLKNQREAGIWVLRNNLAGRLTMQSIKPAIIANPPFNVSDWSGDLLRKDGRWQYGTPPMGNANYAFASINKQNFIGTVAQF